MKSRLSLLGILGLMKLNHRLNLAISYTELFITCSFVQENEGEERQGNQCQRVDMPNLIPAAILSSVYRFPRCCLMPSGYREKDRRDSQGQVCHLGSCVYSICRQLSSCLNISFLQGSHPGLLWWRLCLGRRYAQAGT